MTYQTIPTTWVESIAAAATLALGVLIAGDAFLQRQAAAEQAMPVVRLDPVTIVASRGLVQLEPVTITAQRNAPAVHTVQAVQTVAAHLQRM